MHVTMVVRMCMSRYVRYIAAISRHIVLLLH